MKLHDIGMIAVVNARSIAYLQAIADQGLSLAVILRMNAGANSPGSRSLQEKEEFEKASARCNSSIIELDSGDINAPEIISALQKQSAHVFIYAGAGGVILKKPLLSCGKKFLHVHPGTLPEFRGSTTVYYHLLKGEVCGASAIFLEEKIDCGPILAESYFPFPSGNIDLDYEFDPKIRAATLVKVLQQYIKDGEFRVARTQVPDNTEPYYIMHPLLRHIARLKLEKAPMSNL